MDPEQPISPRKKNKKNIAKNDDQNAEINIIETEENKKVYQSIQFIF